MNNCSDKTHCDEPVRLWSIAKLWLHVHLTGWSQSVKVEVRNRREWRHMKSQSVEMQRSIAEITTNIQTQLLKNKQFKKTQSSTKHQGNPLFWLITWHHLGHWLYSSPVCSFPFVPCVPLSTKEKWIWLIHLAEMTHKERTQQQWLHYSIAHSCR